MWAGQYYLHHDDRNCFSWKGLVTSQVIHFHWCDPLIPLEQFECGWVSNVETSNTAHESQGVSTHMKRVLFWTVKFS